MLNRTDDSQTLKTVREFALELAVQPWSARLAMLDEAERSGVLPTILNLKPQKPQPSDFGLTSAERPDVPVWSRLDKGLEQKKLVLIIGLTLFWSLIAYFFWGPSAQR